MLVSEKKKAMICPSLAKPLRKGHHFAYVVYARVHWRAQMTQKTCAVGWVKMRNAILGNNLKGGKLIIKGYHNALVRENTDKLRGGKCQEAFFP